MAKKKSFSIGESQARALTDTVTAATNYAGNLHIEAIPLRNIELDPDNPRDLVLSLADIKNSIDLHDEYYTRKIEERDSLKSMAHSIAQQGIINPVVVYKHGETYRVVAGERRTLASLLANKEDIPAKILAEKPSPLKLSLLQWIENVEREDLSLWERMRNLEVIFTRYAHEKQTLLTEITATEISQLIGCSLQQAVNYKNVLGAPSTLRLFIQDNQITNIEKAAFIAKAPPDTQDALIDQCIKGSTLRALKQFLSAATLKQSKLLSVGLRGRQTTRVNFGSTKNIHVAKAMIESLLNNEEIAFLRKDLLPLEWHDFKAVNIAFQAILSHLEHINAKKG